MATNSEQVRAVFLRRWMTVGQMVKVLDQLEGTDVLFPNRVGNLTVFRRSDAIGYVDFCDEALVSFNDEAVE